MSNFVIIGSGLLGNELGKIIEKKGDNVKIIKNVKYGQEVIPNGSDVVIITAQSADYKEREMTSDLLFVNTILPVQIIQQSIKAGVKKIGYCSTGSVYDNNSKEHKENEKISMDISNPYKATKYSAELLIRSWEEKFEKIVIFRPFFMYGSNQNEKMLFPRIIDSIKNGNNIKLANKKGIIFNPIHVTDAARFVYQVISDDKKNFDICNIAGLEETSLEHIVRILSKILKKNPIIDFTTDRESILIGSTNKMKSFNFQYEIDLETGLNELVSGITNH